MNFDDYIFVDTETGGLDPDVHPLLEMTYAVGLNKPVTLFTPIASDPTIWSKICDPRAMAVNKYPELHPDGVTFSPWEAWDTFLSLVEGKTWVGAKPDFDVEFVTKFIGHPLGHHYHLFDVRSWMRGRLNNFDMKSKSLESFESITLLLGSKAAVADHTSINDVRALRQAFYLRAGDPRWSVYLRSGSVMSNKVWRDSNGIFDTESETY